jgi:hypothetical protein
LRDLENITNNQFSALDLSHSPVAPQYNNLLAASLACL